jgi:hypothetical protein
MTDKDTGGPAFPCEWDYIGSNREAANGMTLRDYFAAKAMQAMLSNPNCPMQCEDSELAKMSYEIADAMLESRKVGAS